MSIAAVSSPVPEPSKGRIASMDQFRGYCVAGMFVVNFLGGLDVTHQVLKHNNTHFSWADSIMPGFLFACGFSYRLSVARKVTTNGRWPTWRGIIRRSLGLVLASLVLYGLGSSFKTWEAMDAVGIRAFVAELLKADLWEVLAIIGVTQLLLLPVIEASNKVRLVAAVCCSLAHIVLSWWFNYAFVYGQPNVMDELWGAAGRRAWDGGFFGIVSWAVPMLVGTLVYDLMKAQPSSRATRSLLLWGIGLMLLGYAASCLTTLYDVRDSNQVPVASTTNDKLASDPVLPPLENASGRSWNTLLAEPPFVVPPETDARKKNYWMMDKRVVTQSFVLFSTGFTCFVYAFFVLACDAGTSRSRLFTVFGRNALVAYVIHHPVAEMVLSLVPDDSPIWWVTVGFLTFFAITWLFVGWFVNLTGQRPRSANR